MFGLVATPAALPTPPTHVMFGLVATSYALPTPPTHVLQPPDLSSIPHTLSSPLDTISTTIDYECTQNVATSDAPCIAGTACPSVAQSLHECAAICDALPLCQSFIFNRFRQCYTRATNHTSMRADPVAFNTRTCIKLGKATRLQRAWDALAPIPRRCNQTCTTSSKRLRVLVAVTTDSTPASRTRLHNNAVAMHSAQGETNVLAEWLAITYDGNASLWKPLASNLCNSSHVYTQDARECIVLRVADASDLRHQRPEWLGLYSPKLPMQLKHILPLLTTSSSSSIDAVWMLDGDLSLAPSFRLPRFFRLWRCAFEGGPPLVSQPTIRASRRRTHSQPFWPHNHENWRGDTAMGAFAMPFVEQQAPLFDAAYFVWWAEAAGRIVAAVNSVYASDWGADQTWCALGRSYLERVIKQPNRTACALIVEGIDHDDTATIGLAVSGH